MPSEAVEKVLSRLWALDCNARGSEQHGWTAKCPAHDDRDPSFKLDQGDDGRALVFCHAGCTLDQLARALGLDVRELFELEEQPTDRVEVASYDYTDEDGKPLFQVVRFSPKDFRQRRPNGEWGIQDVRRVLYRLPKVIEAVKARELVCLVEGERDVHTLEGKGKVATTCPGGAGKWRDEYTETLRGANVLIIQDVDPVDPKTGHRPGQEHAHAVYQALKGVAAKVIVRQPAVGKDVTDHVAAGYGLKTLVDVDPDNQVVVEPERMQVLSAREFMQLPDPDTEGYLLGPLIYKGHRIVVGGWTGHGKTTFVLHMTAAACYGRPFLNWEGRGDLRALVVDVEQGRRTVKRRIREVGLQDSDRVKYLQVPDGLALDSDKEAIERMERIFYDGHYDIVALDPLYKLTRGDPNDTQAAVELMRRFDDWRERYGFSLLLPMHCRKARDDQPLTVHDLFGSSAWQWGAEMLLGIERKSQSRSWLHLWKDREGEVAEQGHRPVGSHWNVNFSRITGYALQPETQSEKLVDIEPTPSFDRRQFVYELIRDSSGGFATYGQIKNALHRAGHDVTAGALENTLKKLGGYGIYKEQARRKADNIYRLQDELLTAGD
jgi:hypothetical protein